MILISHRGNINGKYPEKENSVEYILHALEKGYDVEIDVWYDIQHGWWLGHDYPQYKTTEDFLLTTNLWVHCKNNKALEYLTLNNFDINFFWHQNDDFTLTSKRWIWAFPGIKVTKGSKAISALPEIANIDTSDFQGVCSDFIIRYK